MIYVLGLFAVQFGVHLRYSFAALGSFASRDHLWACAGLRLHSFGVIRMRIRISDPRSVWIMLHQRNR